MFRQASGATLNPAKLTNENTPATNDVNWIGYQVGTGATAQNIKVLQEGDVLENTYTISEITFQRLKDTGSNVVAAVSNAGKSTHQVELVITANPTSGSGFPITKSFKTTLISDTPATSPTNNVVGCRSVGDSNRPSQTCQLRSQTTNDPQSCMSQADCLSGETVLSGGCTNTGCSVSISQPVGSPATGWFCGGWQDWTHGKHYYNFTSTAHVLCCK